MKVVLFDVGPVHSEESGGSAGASLWGTQSVLSEGLLWSEQVEGKLLPDGDLLLEHTQDGERQPGRQPVMRDAFPEQACGCFATLKLLMSVLCLLLLLRVTGVLYTGFSTRGSDTSLSASPLKSPIRYLNTQSVKDCSAPRWLHSRPAHLTRPYNQFQEFRMPPTDDITERVSVQGSTEYSSVRPGSAPGLLPEGYALHHLPGEVTWQDV